MCLKSRTPHVPLVGFSSAFEKMHISLIWRIQKQKSLRVLGTIRQLGFILFPIFDIDLHIYNATLHVLYNATLHVLLVGLISKFEGKHISFLTQRMQKQKSLRVSRIKIQIKFFSNIYIKKNSTIFRFRIIFIGYKYLINLNSDF